MRWPVERWGTRAVVLAGASTADHLRCALQLLSGDVPRRTVYAHTGWREIDGAWCYLHAGGAIGPDGPIPGVEVELPDPLAGFVLPDPPTGQELVEAVRASFRVIDVGPDRITVPVLATVYRAPLGPCDLSAHLVGATGTGKTELAALAQQHHGAGLDARHLPGSWCSTGNALEGLAFSAAHALMVVDDFAPGGTAADVARMHREADRLLRSQGNRASRLRMRPDSTLRPPRPPRGIILSTGEDVPRGQSLRARVLTLDLAPGELDWSRLTACQHDARAGHYAAALAGYVRWLAPRYAELRDRLRAEIAAERDLIHVSGLHARTPGILADLVIGWRYWLDYAVEVSAIDFAERHTLDRRITTALLEAGANQQEYLAAAEPCGQFLRLLTGALASGRAHCAAADGDRPAHADGWGWRQTPVFTRDGPDTRWEPLGRRIGWVDGDNLYLEPDAAYAEAQEMARHQANSLPVTSRTLWRRLRERGLLKSWDVSRQRNTLRRALGGVKERDVLHLSADALSSSPRPSEPSAQPSEACETPEKRTVPADGSVDGRTVRAAGPSAEPSAETGQKTGGNGVGGRFGRSDTGVEESAGANTDSAEWEEIS
jgi:hypothetical protein